MYTSPKPIAYLLVSTIEQDLNKNRNGSTKAFIASRYDAIPANLNRNKRGWLAWVKPCRLRMEIG